MTGTGPAGAHRDGGAVTADRAPVADLYRRAVEVPAARIPTATHAEHTMGSAIDFYAAQRVPAAFLDMVVEAGYDIEVHGIFPDHLPALHPQARLVHPGHTFGPTKQYNLIRPRYFSLPADAGAGGRPRVLVAVPPGRDYVLHNASLIRHYLGVRGHPAQALRAVVRYPDAEESIADWTGLDRLVGPGDRIVMGYVNELAPLLLADGGEVAGTEHNRCYGLTRLDLPGGVRLCLLGVRFSFWGCIAGRLAAACQRLGAAEIVYAGKLGTLTEPADVYGRLFLPTAYLDHGRDRRILTAGQAPPNGLAACYPHLGSGMHMSVGTVLEEDVAQRAEADAHGVRSMDNEIAQMAHALADTAGPHRTAFSALHFATDYLRRPGEQEHRDIYNLTNHRRAGALRHKQQMISEVARLLRGYYRRTAPGATVRPPDTMTAKV